MAVTVNDPPPARDPWATGAVLFALAFWMLDLFVLRAGTLHPHDDVWEYACAARALLEGHGLRTTVIHPPLWHLRDAAGTVPVLVHGPLLPVLFLPIVLALGPMGPDAAPALAAVFAVIAAWLIQRVGARRFTPAVGAGAAALFTASPLTLRAVHHDVALVVGAALFAGALLLILDRRAFAAGAAVGLAYLARPEMLVAAPLFALGAGRGWARLLGGFAIVASPWWLHLTLATGQPFFNLSSYLLIGYWARPELSPLRDFTLTPERWPSVLREYLPGLHRKWAALFPHAMKRALLAPAGGTGWLAALGAILGIFRLEIHRLAAMALALAAIPVAVQTLTLYDSRYIVPFLPLWTLAATWAAERIASRVRWAARPRAWLSALALMTLPSIGPAVREAATEAATLRPRLHSERAMLAPLAVHRRGDPIVTDEPDFVSWVTHRSTVWLTREEALKLPGPGEPNPALLPLRPRPGTAWFQSVPAPGEPDSL